MSAHLLLQGRQAGGNSLVQGGAFLEGPAPAAAVSGGKGLQPCAEAVLLCRGARRRISCEEYKRTCRAFKGNLTLSSQLS